MTVLPRFCESGNNLNDVPYKNIILSLDCDGNQGELVLFKQYGLKSRFFVANHSADSTPKITESAAELLHLRALKSFSFSIV